MAMSSKHALWQSRRGAAFAVAELVDEDTQTLMRVHFQSAIPKLYRLSYDPSPQISSGVGNILGALYKGGSGIVRAVDDNFDAIAEECLQAMASREWRARQSGCAALGSILPGRRPHEVMDKLKRMWEMTSRYEIPLCEMTKSIYLIVDLNLFLSLFSHLCRCMDDIKETVAKTGLATAKVLSSLSHRLSDKAQTPYPECEKAGEITLEFLLKAGIESESEAVRQFSAKQLVKVMTVASEAVMGKNLPTILERLLESLTTLEASGEMLNYLTLQAEGKNVAVSRGDIDNLRVGMSKGSPVIESLNMCCKFINVDNRKEVLSILTNFIRRGVGLQTRVGVANFIVQMSMICPHELKAMSSRILSSLPSMFNDPSPAVQGAALTAAGHCARVASLKAFQKYIKTLSDMYWVQGSEVTQTRITASNGLRQLVRILSTSEDVVRLDDIAGIIYVGMFDMETSCAKSMKEVWEDVFALHGGARENFRV
tara:strand:- start:30 stop:1478 length:1449 start_codon:yes stop_codon:yes gene_type:complete